MSKYIVEAETTLNAIEDTPRSELPWHAAYGKVKNPIEITFRNSSGKMLSNSVVQIKSIIQKI